MYWPLQENFFDKKSKAKAAKFLINSTQLTQHKKVKEFEKKFASWNGSKYSIYVNSGSSANLLIINSAKELYNWKDSDEIIVPAVTWPTTVTPVIQFNLKPVFVDINIEDFSYNYEELKKKINNKTKAIFIAHLIGYPANVKKIKKIIGKRNILIFEDCCESQGAHINKKKIGNFGLASSFSFYWGHHMSTIEGGMICTNNKKFYDACILKRSHGLARELPLKMHNSIKRKYKDINFNFLFLTDGFNLRSTELNAYIGIEMLKSINKFIYIRNKNYKEFIRICKKYKKYLYVLKNPPGVSSFVFPFIFKTKKIKEIIQKVLFENKIETRPFIAGNLLKQPFLKKFSINYKPNDLINSDLIHENAIYIGNNQYVGFSRLKKLNLLLDKTFIQ